MVAIITRRVPTYTQNLHRTHTVVRVPSRCKRSALGQPISSRSSRRFSPRLCTLGAWKSGKKGCQRGLEVLQERPPMLRLRRHHY